MNNYNDLLENKKCIIYCITNTINNKKYIGETLYTFNNRYDKKWWKYTNNIYLKKDIEKYGKENFKIFVVMNIWAKEKKDRLDCLKFMESYYINYYNTVYPNGYNIIYINEHGKIKKSELAIKELNIKESENKKVRKYRIWTEEEKQIQSKIMSGENNPIFGTKRSQETIEKIRVKAIRRLHSEDTKQKLRKPREKKYPTSKSIYKIDIINNSILKEYGSISEASRDNNIPSSYISSVCLGYQKTACGFKWKYKNEIN